MSKSALVFSLCLMGWSLWPSVAEAVRPGASTGVAETANTTLSEGREAIKTVRGGYVHALSLLCTTAPCEVAVYDSAAGGPANSGVGTLKWEARASSNNSAEDQMLPVPIATDDGIAIEVTGAGASVFTAYE